MPFEVALMKTLHHIPEVVKLLEFFMERGHLFIVIELIPSAMDLRAHTSRNGELNIKDAKDVFLQVLTAVMACHKAGVCHRDIKMANILGETGKLTAKLADFGMGTFIEDSSTPADRHGRNRPYGVWDSYCPVSPARNFQTTKTNGRFGFPKSVPKRCQKLFRKCLASKSEKRLRLRGPKGSKDFENSLLLPSTGSAEKTLLVREVP
ncbi:serine/threonine-protein kinase pim-2-like [Oratosquilla oratoria]|uniref:serine/threonine-protein kinase pim-2-like n=1 Tax=Oratosquilla oratoria TaxID=337810 RepID=UPI003F76DDDC